jgi:hypothetical protein
VVVLTVGPPQHPALSTPHQACYAPYRPLLGREAVMEPESPANAKRALSSQVGDVREPAVVGRRLLPGQWEREEI